MQNIWKKFKEKRKNVVKMRKSFPQNSPWNNLRFDLQFAIVQRNKGEQCVSISTDSGAFLRIRIKTENRNMNLNEFQLQENNREEKKRLDKLINQQPNNERNRIKLDQKKGLRPLLSINERVSRFSYTIIIVVTTNALYYYIQRSRYYQNVSTEINGILTIDISILVEGLLDLLLDKSETLNDKLSIFFLGIHKKARVFCPLLFISTQQ